MAISWPKVEALIAAQRGEFFSPRAPIFVARAPARLDVMGGIADYSGALVLQATLGQTAYAAVQRRRDERLCAISWGVSEAAPVELSLADLGRRGRPKSWAQLQKLFVGARRWAGYVLGGLPVLQRAGLVESWPAGLNLMLISDIPIGAGVASSAAIEIAALHAIAAACQIPLEPLSLAQLCQQVENRVVGAPCGIMDQVTAALGRPRRLLALLCQPCTIEGFVEVSQGYQFVGLHSGVKHSVGGAAYTRVRCAAFMGLRIFETLCPEAQTGGYWCRVTPEQFAAIEAALPEEIGGSEFLARYGQTCDPVTRPAPEERYPVRQASRHPVWEHARVQRFRALLAQGDEAAMSEAGALMYESHASYSACGLGAEETDLIVSLVRERGPAQGFYGAKITGGGSGGTVAILLREEARPQLTEIMRHYAERTGQKAALLTGSLAGAAHWGLRIV